MIFDRQALSKRQPDTLSVTSAPIEQPKEEIATQIEIDNLKMPVSASKNSHDGGIIEGGEGLSIFQNDFIFT